MIWLLVYIIIWNLNFIGLAKIETLQTDDALFRVFYKGAVWVHFIFLITLGAKEYFGTPILCDSSSNEVSKDHSFLKQCLRDLHFMKTRSFHQTFQS